MKHLITSIRYLLNIERHKRINRRNVFVCTLCCLFFAVQTGTNIYSAVIRADGPFPIEAKLKKLLENKHIL